MLCFLMCFYNQACTKVALMVFSILTILAGGANIWMGFQVKNSKLWTSMTGDLNDGVNYQNLTFLLVLAVASLTIATGVFGIITVKFPRKTCICFFSFFSFMCFAFFSGLGILFILVKQSESQIIDTYCKGSFPNYNNLIKDLNFKGLPTQNCRGAIASVFESSFRNVGIAFVVTGGVIFLVFNVQYGLWFRGGPKN